jgi:hypothetical protein
MAMILQHYKDFGARVIGDVDILVKKSDLPRVLGLLQQGGWVPNVARFDHNNPEHLLRWHALNLTHPEGMRIDVHWSFIEENCPALDEAVFNKATLLENNIYVPSPTHLFLQVCVHGVKYSPVPLIRWVADAMTLLRGSEINWEEMVSLASKAHICLPLSQAIRYLQDHFQANIPQEIIGAMQKTPSMRFERWEYHLNCQKYRDLANWVRYCLNRDYLTAGSQIRHIFKYLQTTARLKSLWQVPFYAPYWVFKRLYRLMRSLVQ